MDNSKSTITKALAVIPSAENQKGIENHKKIAGHFQDAAKKHLQAAKHHKAGNHQKAAESTLAAYGHVHLAQKAQKKEVRRHVKNGYDSSHF